MIVLLNSTKFSLSLNSFKLILNLNSDHMEASITAEIAAYETQYSIFIVLFHLHSILLKMADLLKMAELSKGITGKNED